MRLNMPDGAVEILFIALTRERRRCPGGARNKHNENDAHNEAH